MAELFGSIKAIFNPKSPVRRVISKTLNSAEADKLRGDVSALTKDLGSKDGQIDMAAALEKASGLKSDFNAVINKTQGAIHEVANEEARPYTWIPGVGGIAQQKADDKANEIAGKLERFKL